jgi:hypothetical protein
VTPPLGLRLVQAADLAGWEGGEEHHGLVGLIDAIRHVIATGGSRPAWRFTDLIGSGSRREVALTALQTVMAVALPFAGHLTDLVPRSEPSTFWVPAFLASLAALGTMLTGLAAARWIPARWRVLTWGAIALVAVLASIPTAGRYPTRLTNATVETPVRHGDALEPERRVKGSQLSPRAEQYTALRPELRGEDQRLVNAMGGIDQVWTKASIAAAWSALVTDYVTAVALLTLAFFALTQVLKIPAWRVRFSLAPRGRARP